MCGKVVVRGLLGCEAAGDGAVPRFGGGGVVLGLARKGVSVGISNGLCLMFVYLVVLIVVVVVGEAARDVGGDGLHRFRHTDNLSCPSVDRALIVLSSSGRFIFFRPRLYRSISARVVIDVLLGWEGTSSRLMLCYGCVN